MNAATYGASPIKRSRRSRADVNRLKSKLLGIVQVQQPMTVRQVFYRAVSAGLIDKAEAEYKNVVCRLLVEMRRDGEMPFSWITDSTRWVRRNSNSYNSMRDYLDEAARFYRRSVWREQPVYVEVWLEKDALAGVIFDSTFHWDVPLHVTRGYPSLSQVHEAAQDILAEGKPAYLYYLGDHDPSGVDIPRKVEEEVRRYAPGVEIHFERLAVNLDQVERWNLQTRPTKATDSRSKSFAGESVEVDAIEPSDLRALVSDAIEKHLDPGELYRLAMVERAERTTLAQIAGQFAA